MRHAVLQFVVLGMMGMMSQAAQAVSEEVARKDELVRADPEAKRLACEGKNELRIHTFGSKAPDEIKTTPMSFVLTFSERHSHVAGLPSSVTEEKITWPDCSVNRYSGVLSCEARAESGAQSFTAIGSGTCRPATKQF